MYQTRKIHFFFELAIRNKGLMLMLPLEYFDCPKADLNMHRALSKQIQNENDNLNDF
jgi:hypothetical protein